MKRIIKKITSGILVTALVLTTITVPAKEVKADAFTVQEVSALKNTFTSEEVDSMPKKDTRHTHETGKEPEELEINLWDIRDKIIELKSNFAGEHPYDDGLETYQESYVYYKGKWKVTSTYSFEKGTELTSLRELGYMREHGPAVSRAPSDSVFGDYEVNPYYALINNVRTVEDPETEVSNTVNLFTGEEFIMFDTRVIATEKSVKTDDGNYVTTFDVTLRTFGNDVVGFAEYKYARQKLEEGLGLFDDDLCDYMKIFLILTYMQKHTTYSYDGYGENYGSHERDGWYNMVSQRAYGPGMQPSEAGHILLSGSGICVGYALLIQDICNDIGLECITVHSPTHVWNAVKLRNKYGDKWYTVDGTYFGMAKEDEQRIDYASYYEETIKRSGHSSYMWGSTINNRMQDFDFVEPTCDEDGHLKIRRCGLCNKGHEKIFKKACWQIDFDEEGEEEGSIVECGKKAHITAKCKKCEKVLSEKMETPTTFHILESNITPYVGRNGENSNICYAMIIDKKCRREGNGCPGGYNKDHFVDAAFYHSDTSRNSTGNQTRTRILNEKSHKIYCFFCNFWRTEDHEFVEKNNNGTTYKECKLCGYMDTSSFKTKKTDITFKTDYQYSNKDYPCIIIKTNIKDEPENIRVSFMDDGIAYAKYIQKDNDGYINIHVKRQEFNGNPSLDCNYHSQGEVHTNDYYSILKGSTIVSLENNTAYTLDEITLQYNEDSKVWSKVSREKAKEDAKTVEVEFDESVANDKHKLVFKIKRYIPVDGNTTCFGKSENLIDCDTNMKKYDSATVIERYYSNLYLHTGAFMNQRGKYYTLKKGNSFKIGDETYTIANDVTVYYDGENYNAEPIKEYELTIGLDPNQKIANSRTIPVVFNNSIPEGSGNIYYYIMTDETEIEWSNGAPALSVCVITPYRDHHGISFSRKNFEPGQTATIKKGTMFDPEGYNWRYVTKKDYIFQFDGEKWSDVTPPETTTPAPTTTSAPTTTITPTTTTEKMTTTLSEAVTTTTNAITTTSKQEVTTKQETTVKPTETTKKVVTTTPTSTTKPNATTKKLSTTTKPVTTKVSVPKTKIKKYNVKSKKLSLTLKKVKGVKYQVQVSDSKSFSKKKVIYNKTIKNTLITISNKKIKSKKKLYVRVRTVKAIGKKKYYSKWVSKRVK